MLCLVAPKISSVLKFSSLLLLFWFKFFLDSHSHGYSLDSHHRLFAQKKKGCYPLPAPLSPEKDKAPLFFFGKQGESLAVSASSAIVAEALLPPCSNDCTPRSGRVAVGAIAPTYCNGAKPSAEFRENIESRVGLGSSSVYRESASPSGVPDALTPNNTLDSKKSAVCSRSGASEDSLLASGSKFARANLHKMISPSSVYSKGASPSGVPDALTLRILESRKDCRVCSRSGGNGGLAPIADTQVLLHKTCVNRMECVA